MFAEILDAAGVPAGVFNLVQGDDPGVGVPLAGHADVDTISFTGSTRAGIDIARNAAPTVKRVTQELGGKSPDIVLDDEAFTENVGKGVTKHDGQDTEYGLAGYGAGADLEKARAVARRIRADGSRSTTPSTSAVRSAGTRRAATGGSGASSASTTIWRPREFSARG
ncbi:aldehyde dehydrogenase family protein [Streptomyces sp. NBC_01764]|uniref:aldehyde dehydrogenase family protein n=1 Tax=Streptomyces sp. NBC_01764 TaxID=2975935 RepID=UPI00338DE934